MSGVTRGAWTPSDDLPQHIGGPPTLSMPDDWTLSTAWKRAQTEADRGGPVNDAERIVNLSDGEEMHRCLWALQGRTLVAYCDCHGHSYHDGWCAHLASLWWQWIRGCIVVSHLNTGREYSTPPAWLQLDDDPTRYDELTPAVLDAFLTCRLGSLGVREYARQSGRSPGTVGNLLADAPETAEAHR
ncbi:SWIM zinc finger family protein [Haloarcula laminariae]|uniref:SWIM zinc finger family protein n=1 Tax=Haloarcula laminariae TaxID=2961577 RepID=UPI0021C61E92|nr:SWIM zinc finger family protein [Halomicroarcula laminariae]